MIPFDGFIFLSSELQKLFLEHEDKIVRLIGMKREFAKTRDEFLELRIQELEREFWIAGGSLPQHLIMDFPTGNGFGWLLLQINNRLFLDELFGKVKK